MTATPAQIQEAVTAEILDYYRPESGKGAVAWCEEFLKIMPAENKRLAGRFDTSHSPYVRPVIQFIAREPPFDAFNEQWIMKSSGTGISLGVLAGIAWKADNRPGHVIYTINSQNDAKKISDRLTTLLENCAAFQNKPAFDDEKDQTMLTMRLRNMNVFLMGGTAGQIAGKPNIDLAVADEIELQEGTKGESEVPDLLRDRFKNSEDGAIVGLCKPLSFEGVINQQYLTGSRHKFFVPCPFCNFFQELVYANLYYHDQRDLLGNYDLDKVIQNTRYRCCACEKLIEEKWKRDMVLAYELRPTNFGQDEKYRPEPRKMSLHISDLYSQFPGAAWGLIAKENILAQGDSRKMQAVFNSRFGLPQKEQASETDVDELALLSGPGFGQPDYEQGTLPVLPARLIGKPEAGAVFKLTDVQGDVKKSVTVAFDADENLYVVDYSEVFGFDELMTFDQIPARRPDGALQSFPIYGGGIDSGFQPDKVRAFCLRARNFYIPVMGRGGHQVRDIADRVETKLEDNKLIAYHFNDAIFKTKLYIDRIGNSLKQRKAELAAQPGDVPFRSPYPFIRFFKDAPEEFRAEFCQESRIQKRLGGKLRWVWKEDVKGNDFGDAVKIALVLWYFLARFFELNPKKFTPLPPQPVPQTGTGLTPSAASEQETPPLPSPAFAGLERVSSVPQSPQSL